MSDVYRLSDAPMARLTPCFAKSHGKPRGNDRSIPSGMVSFNCNGLQWRHAPMDTAPQKTLHTRCKRWNDKGIVAQVMAGTLAKYSEETTVMIDATRLKADRTANRLNVEKGRCGRLIDRTKGGMTIKLRAICDSQGRSLDVWVSAGQVSDDIQAQTLLGRLPKVERLFWNRSQDAD